MSGDSSFYGPHIRTLTQVVNDHSVIQQCFGVSMAIPLCVVCFLHQSYKLVVTQNSWLCRVGSDQIHWAKIPFPSGKSQPISTSWKQDALHRKSSLISILEIFFFEWVSHTRNLTKFLFWGLMSLARNAIFKEKSCLTLAGLTLIQILILLSFPPLKW